MGAIAQAIFHLVGLILIVLDLALYIVTLGPIYTLYKLPPRAPSSRRL